MIFLTKFSIKRFFSIIVILPVGFMFFQCRPSDPSLAFNKGSHIIIIGNNLVSRMMEYVQFETEMHVRYPDSSLYIRNMSVAG